MRDVKTVDIKDFESNLSSYLGDVRRGGRILVSDDCGVVAEIHKPGVACGEATDMQPLLEEWVRSGVVSPPTRPRIPLPDSPIRLAEGAAQRLLDADRSDRPS